MRLKAIELVGFKSFARKTRINFQTGLTEIVGPNGSGKSNVIEAIRWALGEQSAKKLRSSKMTDVIFSGSSHHPALNRARVTLWFDNQDRTLNCSYETVQVTRTLDRDGESGYYLNGRRCRLRDLQRVFMNSGIGSGSFSLISQGQVQKIFRSRPQNRRFIVETAAGVYRYQAQKHVARKRLLNVNGNLTRLGDVVNELKDRTSRLSGQKVQAQRYLVLSQFLKCLRGQQLLVRLRRLRSKAGGILKRYRNGHRKISELRVTVRNFRHRQIYFKEQNRRWRTLSDRFQGKLLNTVRLADKLRSRRTLSHQNLSFQRKQIDSGRRRNASLVELNQKMAKRLRGDVKHLMVLRPLIGRQQKRVHYFQSLHLVKHLQAARHRFDELQDRSIKLMQQIARVTNQIHVQMRSQRGFNVRLGDLQHQVMKFTKLIVLNRKHLRQTEGLLTRLRSRLVIKRRRIIYQIKQYHLSRNRFHRQLIAERKNSRRLQTTTAQHSELAKLMAEYTGFYRGERNVLLNARHVSGILGPVVKFLQVPQLYIQAIEMVLRSRLQQILVSDHQVAQKAIAFLNRKRLGRATFLPIREVTPHWVRSDFLKKCQRLTGWIGVAASLVWMPRPLERVRANLLGNVLVTQNLRTAIAVSRIVHHRYQVVTLKGAVISAGGSITGGRGRYKRHGILAQHYRLKQLAVDVHRLRKNGDRIHAGLVVEHRILNNRSLRLSEVRHRRDLKQQKFAVKTQIKLHYVNTIKKQNKEKQTIKTAIQNLKEIHNQATNATNQPNNKKKLQYQLKRVSSTADHLKSEIQSQSKNIIKRSHANQHLEEILKHEQRKQLEFKHKINSYHLIIHRNQNRSKQIHLLLTNARQKIQQVKVNQNQSHYFLLGQDHVLKHLKHRQVLLKERIRSSSAKVNQITNVINRYQNSLARIAISNRQLHLQLSRIQKRTVQVLRIISVKYHRRRLNRTRGSLDAKEIKEQLIKVRRQRRRLGAVNLKAIQEFDQIRHRYRFVSHQLNDLVHSRHQLLSIMNRVNSTIKAKFKTTFNRINQMFKLTYGEIFKGGQACLKLTDPQHLLTTGITIMAQPPGKRYRSMELLSDGERALTAIALLFAIIRIHPVPFCVLDEAEATLDLVNVGRFARYINRLKRHTQFIIITHRKETMLYADYLYGITMQEPGISKVVSVNLSHVKSER